MKKIINYIGWVGHNNIGDEALFEANKKIFSNYKLEVYKKKFYSGVSLFGGGTIIPEWVKSTPKNKYNYAFGVGVRDPDFWGQFPQRLIKLLKRFNFNYMGVRGNVSKKILKKWGISSEIIGDPVLSLVPKKYKKKKTRIIAINIGISKEKTWDGNNHNFIVSEMVKVIKYLDNHNFKVFIIPFWTEDVECCKELSEKTNAVFFNEWSDVDKSLNLISNCDVLIGEKLHSIVFSAACYVPFISLAYRPKCYDFADSVEFGEYVLKTNEITSKKIISLFKKINNNYDGLKNILKINVNDFRGKQREASSNIINELSNLDSTIWTQRGNFIHHRIVPFSKKVICKF
jgi:polysaccharide pyruvyl transferase WcaK-like protein